ncbi:MAG: hypothetical protein GXP35_01470 [Actinobacteria bacterium]|nr:hypothetical protein [Actinomycetota bacterium]
MMNRTTALPLVLAASLALAACGGASEDSTSPTDPPPAEDSPDPTVDTLAATPAVTPLETTTDEGADDADGQGDGCDAVLTPDEIDSVFGTTVEINGGRKFCTIIFASDAVGSINVFDGSEADEAIEVNLANFADDDRASFGGVLLEDGRGFVDGDSVVVRGDSGRVFTFDVPDSVSVPDVQAAMQEIADLLLTR